MLDVAKPDNVESVTDPHRPKDFLDPTRLGHFWMPLRLDDRASATICYS